MWPFGKKKRARFIDQASFEKNLESQTAMAPQTVAQLHGLGVRSGAPLRLEYFFYADSPEAGEALARALVGKGYSSECRPSGDGSPLLCITGWSTPISIDERTVVAWTAEMCRIGYEHDCEFDGWGTNPEQPELQN